MGKWYQGSNITCGICGEVFYVAAWRVRRSDAKVAFCSQECYHKSRKGNSSGPNSNTWQGGKTAAGTKIRNSEEYAAWRKAVFERDNYTCVLCDVTNCKLNADHIKRFSQYPELRLDINNGRTLCIPCHKKTPNYGNRGLKRKKIKS